MRRELLGGEHDGEDSGVDGEEDDARLDAVAQAELDARDAGDDDERPQPMRHASSQDGHRRVSSRC
jgi:hypothetical protein